MKYHKSLHDDDRMTHCLHVDLAGPFPQSVDCYKYFMVGVLRLPNYPALSRMINLIEAIEFEGYPIGEKRVRRIHTDRA
eukprot:1816805-Amphidinium_carterae.1